MPTDQENPIVRVIRRAARSESEHRPDGELLARFTADRDPAAFETLVHRHGGTVWRVCRDVLGDSPAAEDAFQATFLVLVRKAGSIRLPGTLAPWLHGVAHRIACRAWKTIARSTPTGDVMAVARPDTRVDDRDTARVLHEELRRVPAKYATPLVLCYLEGRTTEEAAEELQWPVGTVKVRLMRGREALKDRLVRRGVTSAVVGSILMAPTAAVAVPGPVLENTIRAAEAYATGAAVASASLALARGELQSMLWTGVLAKCGALLVVGSLAGLMLFGVVKVREYGRTIATIQTSTPQAPAVKPDLELLQGTWSITTLEVDGAKMDKATIGGASITLKGTAFTTKSMGAVYEGTYKLNPDASPKTIDMTFTKGPEKGNTSLAIYKLDGDKWTICLTVTAKERPTKFATAAGSGLALEELTRGEPAQKEAAPAPRPAKAQAKLTDDQKKELDRFAGDWAMVSGTIGGQAMPDVMLKTMKREVKGNELTVTMNGQVYFKATLTIDPTKSPRTVDYAMTEGMTKGKTQLGIYEWEDGTLRFSMASPGQDRPTDFTTKADDGRTVSVWKRVTK